tara:strand:- start:66 stop:485 length:420 start_codon:yes stop_codon:yes gene_type:complete
MVESMINELSIELSNKISKLVVYDVKEVATLIKVEIKFLIKDIILEYATQAEKEYLKLLEEQSKNKIGSLSYTKLGYKLSAAKQKKAAANRTAHNMNRQDDLHNLKKFIIDKFGKQVIKEFNITKFDKNTYDFPIYKTR